MEKVIEAFESLQVKAKIIDESMILIPHKVECLSKFTELTDENDEIKDLEKKVKLSLQNHEDLVKKEYKEATNDIARVQMKMMHLLKCLDEQEKHKQTEIRALQPIDIPGTPKLYEREGASQAFSELNTPRMLVSDYAKSPFAKKKTKVQLQFTDFEADIANEDFTKVPTYMKGRVTCSELQEFLDSVVIKTFTHKYKILHQHRSALKPSEFNLQSMFRSQESYFEGEKFVTVGDIARILEKNVDKKHDRLLQMLRHLHVIREARKATIICYIWTRK